MRVLKSIALACLLSVAAFAQYTTTTHYNLKKPNTGVLNWDAYLNGDFDAIDTLLSGGTPLSYSSSTNALNVAAPGSLVFTNAGVFTNTQMNQYIVSLVNGCNPLTEFRAAQGTNADTEGVTGCVAMPNTATVHQSSGVAGYSTNSFGASSGGGTGGYFEGRQLANGGASWGLNELVQDTNTVTGHQLAGNEVDVNFFGAPARVWGIIISGASSGAAPSGNGNAAAVEVRAPGYAGNGVTWNSGINVDIGATSVCAICINPISSGNTQSSQSLEFLATNSGGTTLTANMALDSNGVVNIPCSNANLSISSGFNTGTLNTGHTGFCSFTVTVGSGTAGSTGVLSLPTDTAGWICRAENTSRAALISQSANTSSSVTLTNYGSTFAATNWTTGDILAVTCAPR